MWAIQYRTTDESENAWTTIAIYENEIKAINDCREMNVRANKIAFYKVRRIEWHS
jgi:hypothetical protein